MSEGSRGDNYEERLAKRLRRGSFVPKEAFLRDINTASVNGLSEELADALRSFLLQKDRSNIRIPRSDGSFSSGTLMGIYFEEKGGWSVELLGEEEDGTFFSKFLPVEVLLADQKTEDHDEKDPILIEALRSAASDEKILRDIYTLSGIDEDDRASLEKIIRNNQRFRVRIRSGSTFRIGGLMKIEAVWNKAFQVSEVIVHVAFANDEGELTQRMPSLDTFLGWQQEDN